MDLTGAFGIALSLLFGVISLHQGSELKFLKKAVRAHTQADYNYWWKVGYELDELQKSVVGGNIDAATVLRRSAAANALSHSGRSLAMSIAEEYADFKPTYEPAWQPKPLPHKPTFWQRLVRKPS
jgi:hypothetical protein